MRKKARILHNPTPMPQLLSAGPRVPLYRSDTALTAAGRDQLNSQARGSILLNHGVWCLNRDGADMKSLDGWFYGLLLSVSLLFSVSCTQSSQSNGSSPIATPEYSTSSVRGDWLLKVDDLNRQVYNFFLYVPADYDATTSLYPVVIFLHGDDGTRVYAPEPDPVQLQQGPLKPLCNVDGSLAADNRLSLNPLVQGAFIVYPKIPLVDETYENLLGYWNSVTMNKILDYLLANYRITNRRVYITGLIMGGGGTWYIANDNLRSDLLPAAIVPVCNELDSSLPVTGNLTNLPIWQFQSFDDPVVPYGHIVTGLERVISTHPDIMAGYPFGDAGATLPAATDETVSYLPGTGLGPWLPGVVPPSGLVTFTLYKTGGHDAWDPTYANDAVWTWLFANTR